MGIISFIKTHWFPYQSIYIFHYYVEAFFGAFVLVSINVVKRPFRKFLYRAVVVT